MVFFHPCRDVRQAAWDPCSYRWIIWSKWEIELCVISAEMVGEAMCLYDGTQWCSACGEEEGSKNRSLGNPSDQFMCFGYLPSPGHLERPTSSTLLFFTARWSFCWTLGLSHLLWCLCWTVHGRGVLFPEASLNPTVYHVVFLRSLQLGTTVHWRFTP